MVQELHFCVNYPIKIDPISPVSPHDCHSFVTPAYPEGEIVKLSLLVRIIMC